MAYFRSSIILVSARICGRGRNRNYKSAAASGLVEDGNGEVGVEIGKIDDVRSATEGAERWRAGSDLGGGGCCTESEHEQD
jgi:ribosomal protein S5